MFQVRRAKSGFVISFGVAIGMLSAYAAALFSAIYWRIDYFATFGR
ncbi:MAG: hypothetical protein OSB26_13955 [Woeseiaceae bacterium]|jgi:hypothetical protein|nr:hypothetical protein [Woeseiaceae bacterium]